MPAIYFQYNFGTYLFTRYPWTSTTCKWIIIYNLESEMFEIKQQYFEKRLNLSNN